MFTRRQALALQRLLPAALVLPWFCTGNSLAATVSWNTDVSGSWHTSSNWSGGAPPGSFSDTVIDRPAANPIITYSTGTTTINSLSASEAFKLIGGELRLNSASTLSGPFTFMSSRLVVNDALTVNGDLNWSQVAEFSWPGVTTLNGITTASFGAIAAGHRVVNRGTATFSNSVGLGSGAVFENDAIGTLQLNDGFESGLSGVILVEPAIYNSGTIRKNSGTGQVYLSNVHNSGVVRVQQGMLAVGSGSSSGRFEVAPGATMSLGGKHTLTSASVVDAPNADVWINFPTITGSGGQFAGSFSAAKLTVYNGSFVSVL